VDLAREVDLPVHSDMVARRRARAARCSGTL
jgi:hypothetical protein